MLTIRTVGHGTLEADEFAALVVGADLGLVVDVRRYPGSRRHPHFGSGMEEWLAVRGVDYRWLGSLGGRREPMPSSPNLALRNPQFRGYADYMASSEFAAGVRELVNLGRARPTAVMCAESVWWRCHRRLLADHLVLVEGTRVEHLFHDGRLAEHAPTPEARRVENHVVYDISTQGSLLDDES
jgi:uncharacterized protein (DUF488 family)